MTELLLRLYRRLQFYVAAITKYQIHSPFVYSLAETVLEDKRWYYAFRDIERLRAKMLASQGAVRKRDAVTGQERMEALSKLAGQAASSAKEGQRLFRLVNWLNPQNILELGTSVGIGSLYLISGARTAKLFSLELCPETAGIARANFDIMGFSKQVTVSGGAFENTLLPALGQLKPVDFVFFDANHPKAATLEYFEKSLPYAQDKTAFVFHDIHRSASMEAAWKAIQQHSRVTITIDFFGLSLAFINPEFKEKQHYKIVPAHWKIWKFY